MNRIGVVVLAASALAVLIAGRVAASTDQGGLQPQRAAPGATVELTIDPFNCPILDQPPPTLQMRLTGPAPETESGGTPHAVLLTRAGDDTYSFTVPSIPAGRYDIQVGCFAEGGFEGIVTNMNGGEPGFRVLPSPPATSTEPFGTRQGGIGEPLWPLGVAFMAGAAVAWHRSSRRASKAPAPGGRQ